MCSSDLLVVHVGEYDLSESPKNYRSEQALALIDTGASLCMIDKYLAERLSLIQIDKCDISGVGGLKPHPVYMAAVWIPQLELSQVGRFVAGYLKDGGQSHDVILGRDFLSKVIMIYDGLRSQVTISSPKLIK